MKLKLHRKNEDGDWIWYLGWTSQKNLLTVKDVGCWFTILLGDLMMLKYDRYDSSLEFVLLTKNRRAEYGIRGLDSFTQIRAYKWVTRR